MISRSSTMLICTRMANRCITQRLAPSPSQGGPALSRRWNTACLVFKDRHAKKTQSLCEIRTIGTVEPTSEDSQIDGSSATKELPGQALDSSNEEWDQMIADQLFYYGEFEAPEEENPSSNQAEDSISVKTLTAGDIGMSSVAYQPRKGYHDIRSRTSRGFSDDKKSASAPGTGGTEDFDQCMSLTVDDAEWIRESWITNDAKTPLSGDSNADQLPPEGTGYEQCMSETAAETEAGDTGSEVRSNSESTDLADFANYLESIQETKSFEMSELEALFKQYVASNKAQLEPDLTVYDSNDIVVDAGRNFQEDSTLSPALLSPVYKKPGMSPAVSGPATDPFTFSTMINEERFPAGIRYSQEPTNLSGSDKSANQIYLDEIQSIWRRDLFPTSTSTSTSTPISTDMGMATKAEDVSDFSEFLRREYQSSDSVEPYRPFKTIQVRSHHGGQSTSDKTSTGLDKSLKGPSPAAPKEHGRRYLQKVPSDKPSLSRIDSKTIGKLSNTLVVLAVLQQALNELKTGKGNLKTKISITKPKN